MCVRNVKSKVQRGVSWGKAHPKYGLEIQQGELQSTACVKAEEHTCVRHSLVHLNPNSNCVPGNRPISFPSFCSHFYRNLFCYYVPEPTAGVLHLLPGTLWQNAYSAGKECPPWILRTLKQIPLGWSGCAESWFIYFVIIEVCHSFSLRQLLLEGIKRILHPILLSPLNKCMNKNHFMGVFFWWVSNPSGLLVSALSHLVS